MPRPKDDLVSVDGGDPLHLCLSALAGRGGTEAESRVCYRQVTLSRLDTVRLYIVSTLVPRPMLRTVYRVTPGTRVCGS